MSLFHLLPVFALSASADSSVVPPPPGLTQDVRESYEAIRERELAGLLSRLAEHAEWCKKRKLWLQRVLAYEALLVLDPENEVAHRGLGHKKQRDGSWVPSKRPKPIDRSRDDLEEALRRRAELTRPFIEALQALLKRGGEPLPVEVKGRVLADVLAVEPDNEWARAERFEVKHEGRWVMMEVANTASGRAELDALLQTSREELKPAEVGALSSLEESLDLEFTAALERGGVRVLGTVEQAEIEQCSANLRVARALLRAYVGGQCAYSDDFTYFLLKNSTEQATFLANHPKVEDSNRAFYQNLESVTLPGARHFGSWSDDDARRIDSACRQGISNLLYHGHEITAAQGWAFEGVGLYFTDVVVGTHLTWFVSPSRYLSADDAAVLREKLSRRDVNWLDEARALMEDDKLPKFHTVVGRDVNRLSTEDLLTCNAAIAYFVEGRPGVLPKVLKKLGRGRTAHEVFLEELSLDLMQFDERLRRWLVATAG